MTPVEILQLALAASRFARELIAKMPAGTLTPELRQALDDERASLNATWEALAPLVE